MDLEIKRNEKAKRMGLTLTKAYDGDVGWDVPVCWEEEKGEPCTILVASDEVIDVPSGLSVKLPNGYWAEIKARGSSFLSRNLHVHDAVIDNGFTGEIKIGVRNVGPKPIAIADGQRLAQLIVNKIHNINIKEVDSLPETERGGNEKGSSGD